MKHSGTSSPKAARPWWTTITWNFFARSRRTTLTLSGLSILVLCWFSSTPPASTAQTKLAFIPEDYRAYLAAVELQTSAKHAEAIAAVAPVWNTTPPSPLRGRAAVLSARSSLALQQPTNAASVLERERTVLPQPEGGLLLGEALEAAGRKAAAAAAYQTVYFEYPVSQEAGTAGERLLTIEAELGPECPPPMPSWVLKRADVLRRAGRLSAMRTELLSAMSHLGKKDKELAMVRSRWGSLRELQALNVSTPEADAERLYLIHAAARSADRAAEAAEAVEQLLRSYPDSLWTMEALVSWGNHHLLRNDVSKFEPLYRECYQRFPKEPEGAYCHWKVTWHRHMQRKSDAQAMFEEHLRLFPESEKAAVALYFLKRYDEVLARHPLSWYAVLAREKGGAPPAVQMDSFTPSLPLEQRFSRAAALESAGFSDWAEVELRYAAAHEGQPFVGALALAEFYFRQSQWDRGIRAVKSVAKGYLAIPLEQAPQRFWRAAFPLPWREALQREAKTNSLDPFLVAALIRQESEWNPRAVSRARAYGLTQVLPATGRQLSRKLGLRRFTTATLYEPEVNLKLGTHYLRGLLQQHDGRWEHALASYNAGKTRTEQWLGWYDYREPAEFVETIPFTETRTYIQAVLRNADVYQRLYGDPRFASKTHR